MDNLQQRFIRIQKQVEQLRNQSNFSGKNTEQIIDNIDNLIKQLRDYEEQIRTNALQPMSEYERLIPDCQVYLISYQMHYLTISYIRRQGFLVDSLSIYHTRRVKKSFA